MIAELVTLPKGFEGPAWLLSSTGAVVLVYNYIFIPFIKYFYSDFLKDYWKRKLEIQNEAQEGIVGSKHSVDLIEGQYHLLARHLITVCYRIGKDLQEGADIGTEGLIYTELRTNMSDLFNKTISSLHHYQYRENKIRLDSHLRLLTDEEKKAFYKPIVDTLFESQGDSSKIRNIVLSQIDTMIAQAITKTFAK